MAIRSLKEYLVVERLGDHQRNLQFEKLIALRNKALRRMLDSNLNFMAIAFRQGYQYMQLDIKQERLRMARHKGVALRMIDSKFRLMSMGYNKL